MGGDTVTLQAETRDRFGNVVADAVVEWSSSDAAVVEVDALGRVMSHGAGRAVVAATAGDAVDAATVVVDQRIAAVALGPAPDTLRSVGATAVVDVTASDRNGFEVRGAEITWVSLDVGVMTVDATGAVTARGRGSASVVASADGVADTLVLAVIPWGRVTVSMDPGPATQRADGRYPAGGRARISAGSYSSSHRLPCSPGPSRLRNFS